ncbi:MAG: hypothetical protein ABFS38_11295 [Bacteroidota bacterium]
MGKLNQFLLIMVLLCIEPICKAQTRILVSDPQIELKENVIHISYDILNGNPSDYYTVYMNITDVGGRKIRATALSGDIGQDVPGGMNRNIRWDLEADQLFMNEKIYFEIFVRTTPHSDHTGVQNQDASHETVTRESFINTNPPPVAMAKSYSTAGIVLQSLAVPGLGLSRMTGNPHWLRGLAGYGCLAGSFILNSQSMITYDGIEDYTGFEERYEQLQKSITQDQISELLAYSAIGIWVTDVIWTLVGISKYQKRSMVGEVRGISVMPGIDPLTYAPMVGVTVRF